MDVTYVCVTSRWLVFHERRDKKDCFSRTMSHNRACLSFNEGLRSRPRRKDTLQKVLEKPLEKKTGRNYGPPGTKLLVYFIDDMNMPEVDTYGTVQPHTLIRQHIDYNHW